MLKKVVKQALTVMLIVAIVVIGGRTAIDFLDSNTKAGRGSQQEGEIEPSRRAPFPDSAYDPDWKDLNCCADIDVDTDDLDYIFKFYFWVGGY